METLNEKPCQYCGENFTSLRSSKKYCSNNCRQMDYFKRNGLTLVGNPENEEKEETEPKVSEVIVKEISLYGNHNEEENEEQENTGSHLHLVTATEEEHEEKEQEEEVAEEETKETLNVKDDTDNKQEETVNEKHDNSFPETAIVKDDRQINSTVKSFVENPETILKQNEEAVKAENKILCKPSELNVKSSPLTQNTVDTVKQTSNVKDVSSKVMPEALPKYQYVNPKLFDWIEKHSNKTWYYNSFISPDERWGFDSLQKIKWVSPRIRCLFESLLKLSNCLFIDRQSLLAITDAFIRLTETNEFKGLPNNFPYITPVKELRDKLISLISEVKGQDIIRFRLTPRKKAFIMAMRYEMAPFVPSMKFSQLTFGDEHLLNKDDEDDDEQENNKDDSEKIETMTYRERYRRRKRRRFAS
jgi:chemotaxis protein histidine kinase CheA